jgi:hypothetical protein
MNDISAIKLRVEHWTQAIANERDGGFMVAAGRTFRFSAHADEDQGLTLTSGEKIQALKFSLSILRGMQENPLQRGIGVLAYYPPQPVRHDIDATESFIGGWFWLPEDSYDEVWTQVRENRFGGCVAELEIAPLEWPKRDVVWNVQNNQRISILGAGLMFERPVVSHHELGGIPIA